MIKIKCEEILNKIADKYKEILQDNLVGIYVHGSIAFGCFNSNKSDIDFIVVINNAPTLEQKELLIKALLNLSEDAPVKGFEMSVVLAENCKPFVYPTPFELHYSIAHLDSCKNNLTEYCKTMNGTDKDLAAHFTVINTVGYTLIGKPIEEVFGAVPKDDYLDSIKSDIENAKEEIKENPIYVILNLCRVLAYKEKSLILSKQQGGLYGATTVPKQYVSLVSKALRNYTTEKNDNFDEEPLQEFCGYMLDNINGSKMEGKCELNTSN